MTRPTLEALADTEDYLEDLIGESAAVLLFSDVLTRSGVSRMKAPTLDQLDEISDQLIERPMMEEKLAGRYLKMKTINLRFTHEE